MDTTPATTRGTSVGRTAVVLVLAVLPLVGLLAYSELQPQPDKVRRTKVTLATVQGALAMYFGEQGRYPDRLAELVPGFLSPDNPLKDSWRRDFVYSPAASAGHPFVLLSNGPDGLPGTKDDLDPWMKN